MTLNSKDNSLNKAKSDLDDVNFLKIYGIRGVSDINLKVGDVVGYDSISSTSRLFTSLNEGVITKIDNDRYGFWVSTESDTSKFVKRWDINSIHLPIDKIMQSQPGQTTSRQGGVTTQDFSSQSTTEQDARTRDRLRSREVR